MGKKKRGKEELDKSSDVSDASDSSDVPILRPKQKLKKKKLKKSNFQDIQNAVTKAYYDPNTSERLTDIYNKLKIQHPKWTREEI